VATITNFTVNCGILDYKYAKIHCKIDEWNSKGLRRLRINYKYITKNKKIKDRPRLLVLPEK